MLAVFGIMSITSGTCLACGATKSRFEKEIDIVGGILLVAGLAMIGLLIPMIR